jgi:TPR repeat protein
MLANGRGVPKDERAAVRWYRAAAEQGNTSAQFNLGFMLANGRGVLKDERAAVRWYRAAAEQGDADAQFYLGVMLANGWGVPKDEREAVRWYRAAAEQGNAEAQFNLGVMLANGQGVPKDEREAVRWYRAATEQGLASAQFNLGFMLANGWGVPKDEREAVRWYRAAAEQGFTDAQTNLARMLALGWGVPKDEREAYFWALLAAVGNDSGARLRDLIEPSLTHQQRAAAQAAARDWQPKVAGQSFSPPTPPAAPAASPSPESTGTGFRIARDSFVTNHHVVEGCRQLRIAGSQASVRASDARTDLALISAPVPGPVAALRAQRALVGEAVMVAGFPLQGLLSGFQVTTGTLASLSGLGGDTSRFQLTAPVQPGNSGGPVLDATGRVMGVVVSKLNAIRTAQLTGDIPQNVNFAISGNALRSFLDANGIDYQTTSADRALANTGIAQQAQGFTVRIECWK